MKHIQALIVTTLIFCSAVKSAQAPEDLKQGEERTIVSGVSHQDLVVDAHAALIQVLTQVRAFPTSQDRAEMHRRRELAKIGQHAPRHKLKFEKR